jgi:hypothetical protein
MGWGDPATLVDTIRSTVSAKLKAVLVRDEVWPVIKIEVEA